MEQSAFRIGVVTVGLVALVAAGCATGGKTASMSPAETVSERQRLMKLHGGLWKDIQDKAKVNNFEGIAVSAEALALNAPRIPAMFPEGSMTDKSKAKPEIWQKFPEFEKAAMTLKSESEKLRDAAKANDASRVQTVMKDFGRNACGSCHTPFRVPPPQQR
ncbi:MAG: cytochrome c [Candidatus Rokubacteria bacterium]|nr:cytochrome c [Candidatus Rokubacteria bacterium]